MIPNLKRHQALRPPPLPEEEACLCPVRALADWISASGIMSGYLFRRIAAGDRPIVFCFYLLYLVVSRASPPSVSTSLFIFF